VSSSIAKTKDATEQTSTSGFAVHKQRALANIIGVFTLHDLPPPLRDEHAPSFAGFFHLPLPLDLPRLVGLFALLRLDGLVRALYSRLSLSFRLRYRLLLGLDFLGDVRF
jgi:hypothetical protein